MSLTAGSMSVSTGKPSVSLLVSVFTRVWSVMLYGTMKMVLMRTPVEIKNPILVTAPLPVTTLSSMTTGGTIFRFETVEESNEQTTMTGTNG